MAGLSLAGAVPLFGEAANVAKAAHLAGGAIHLASEGIHLASEGFHFLTAGLGILGKGERVAEDAAKAERAAARVADLVETAVSGETAFTRAGRAAHKAQEYGEGFEKEFRGLSTGGIPDAINKAERIVIELKPNNARAIRRGLNQVSQYVDDLNREFPGSTP